MARCVRIQPTSAIPPPPARATEASNMLLASTSAWGSALTSDRVLGTRHPPPIVLVFSLRAGRAAAVEVRANRRSQHAVRRAARSVRQRGHIGRPPLDPAVARRQPRVFRASSRGAVVECSGRGTVPARRSGSRPSFAAGTFLRSTWPESSSPPISRSPSALTASVARSSSPAFPVSSGLLLAVRTIVNIQLGLYSRRWRFASVPDLERIVAAVALGSLVSIGHLLRRRRGCRHGMG